MEEGECTVFTAMTLVKLNWSLNITSEVLSTNASVRYVASSDVFNSICTAFANYPQPENSTQARASRSHGDLPARYHHYSRQPRALYRYATCLEQHRHL
jgi:hypothetical protein